MQYSVSNMDDLKIDTFLSQQTKSVRAKFIELYHKEPLLIHAPGRINIIGEHTDYNNGFVMPAAIDKGIVIAIAHGSESPVIYSVKYKDFLAIDSLNDPLPRTAQWKNYFLGVISELKKLGHELRPFNLVFDGDLPSGAGLSSSAALECGFLVALNKLFNLNLSLMEIITIAQAAEHNFVGVKCGIMDQFASVMGRKNYVIQLDCQSMAFQYCHLDLGDYCFLLCNTNVKHSLADSDYNTRRTECQTGIAIIRESFPEIRSLRDVSIQMLDTCSLRMSNKIYNRCRYVIEENGRVLEAARDLENGDLIKLGKKMFLSHEGLSILYDVSCPELDFLVQFASQQESVLGSRMMGGGFGGCTLNLIKYSAVESFINEAQMVYKAEFNRDISCYIVQTGNGVTALQK